MTFEELSDFIDNKMRMSHVYQPVMLKTLLKQGGRCSDQQIAMRLLQQDRSQLEYYEQITRNMVGRVLSKHGIVTHDKVSKQYSVVGYDAFTDAQIEILAQKCDVKLRTFLDARGNQPWRHRKQSSGYISGTLRYEVLKAAKFHCELCGISADIKALEVDHIVPRNRGGSDEITNLQALCYSCNATKGDRDDTDFRMMNRSFKRKEPSCPFCEAPESRVRLENELAFSILDGSPVTEGHTLVIPRRHVASVFELGRPEINASFELLVKSQHSLSDDSSEITGFNIGVNDGQTAGQTVFHCHWHLIPRRHGDVQNPRGGVRNVIPAMGDY